MKFNQNELINDLVKQCNEDLLAVEAFQKADLTQLNYKPDNKIWSVLECIEHLNSYGRFYLPEITQRMANGKNHPSKAEFKSGVLGNYFAKSVSYKEKLNTMNTFSNMNPNGSDLGMAVLDEFKNQLTEMIVLLEKARALNIKKIKTAITISKVIKLRLGDTFRVVIYHNHRHVIQAKKALDRATGQAN